MIKSDFTPDFVRSDLDFAILYFLFLIKKFKDSLRSCCRRLQKVCNLRDLLEDDTQQQALEARISAALREKKQTHFLHQNNTGITQNLSYIGG